MVFPLTTQLLWFLVAIVMIIEVVVMVEGAVVDHIPVLTMVVEGILLISVGIDMANLLDDNFVVASIPRSTPPDTGSVTLTREEYAQFLSQQQAVPSPSTATFVQSGTVFTCLLSSTRSS
ncbi:unnamed protein product [Ilex paraguariensis]|uniref:Uncharacterized protein n=1 Tax=Ilex paraguariensis TaxID=185542 RepID=A0ABC8T6Y2_9AQUA